MNRGDLAALRLAPGDALFLDFDGTLAELGPDPEAIRLDTATMFQMLDFQNIH